MKSKLVTLAYFFLGFIVTSSFIPLQMAFSNGTEKSKATADTMVEEMMEEDASEELAEEAAESKPPVQVFSDVEPNAWFYPYIMELVEDGIVEGYSDGHFGSWEPVNRAELAKMLVLMKTQLRGHWLKDNIFEIALILATIFGWISILSSFRKSQERMFQEFRNQGSSPSAGGNSKGNVSKMNPDIIEKNFKSNWWV